MNYLLKSDGLGHPLQLNGVQIKFNLSKKVLSGSENRTLRGLEFFCRRIHESGWIFLGFFFQLDDPNTNGNNI